MLGVEDINDINLWPVNWRQYTGQTEEGHIKRQNIPLTFIYIQFQGVFQICFFYVFFSYNNIIRWSNLSFALKF